MNETLEDQLLDTLARAYIAKGIPLAKLLDNPIFYKAPLDKRLALLQKYSPSSAKPAMKAMNILSHFGIGAVGGAGAMAALTHDPLKIAIGSGVGGLLGTVIPTGLTYLNHKRDVASDESLRGNRYLEAIAERSMTREKPVPGIDINKLISNAEKEIYPSIANAKL